MATLTPAQAVLARDPDRLRRDVRCVRAGVLVVLVLVGLASVFDVGTAVATVYGVALVAVLARAVLAIARPGGLSEAFTEDERDFW